MESEDEEEAEYVEDLTRGRRREDMEVDMEDTGIPG
jgi:hypothetical protein